MLNNDPASGTISFTVPERTIVDNFWYAVEVTTPTGPCEALPEADSIAGNHDLNGSNQFATFGGTRIPGTTRFPKVGSNYSAGGGLGAFCPGNYEFKTLVTGNASYRSAGGPWSRPRCSYRR